MPTVAITLELPEELVNDARELALLTDAAMTELLQAEIERRRAELEDDAEWEETVLTKALGDALHPDGQIDFEKLNARADSMTLDEFYPEADDAES